MTAVSDLPGSCPKGILTNIFYLKMIAWKKAGKKIVMRQLFTNNMGNLIGSRLSLDGLVKGNLFEFNVLD
ncbi:MAG: hypothetical protein V3R49_06435 [Gammaproteobacteria bacterium]